MNGDLDETECLSILRRWRAASNQSDAVKRQILRELLDAALKPNAATEPKGNMNPRLHEICDRIKATDYTTRANHVAELIHAAEALGDKLTTEDVDGIASTLGPIGELRAISAKLREERNPERIRELMVQCMKLRNGLKTTAQVKV